MIVGIGKNAPKNANDKSNVFCAYARFVMSSSGLSFCEVSLSPEYFRHKSFGTLQNSDKIFSIHQQEMPTRFFEYVFLVSRNREKRDRIKRSKGDRRRREEKSEGGMEGRRNKQNNME